MFCYIVYASFNFSLIFRLILLLLLTHLNPHTMLSFILNYKLKISTVLWISRKFALLSFPIYCGYWSMRSVAIQQADMPLLTCGASCATPSGQSGRNSDHSCDTWMASRLCACGSGASVHRFAQIATHNLPMSTCMVSRLKVKRKEKKN